ncbi:MAG: peptide ABC transporter substrate-binding protein [Verrucomicrobia bacterium]|nr:peptide ABC transporter substrate-binding protein [Verrucomicrobiota bacterium]
MEKQILHVGNGLEPQELDPHLITGTSEIEILGALFEGLVGQNPKDLSPVPGVAEWWEVSTDGLNYTFHLRSGLTWSNSDPLTAEDFLFSFRRMLSPALGAPNAYLLFVLKNAENFHKGHVEFDEVGVSASDHRTLLLQLKNPTHYLLSMLSHPAWFPLPKTTLSRFGDPYGRATGWTRTKSIVSNGPFYLTAWQVNEYIHTQKNDQYWDTDNTRLKDIFFYPTESRDAEMRAFTAGQLHITEAVPPSKVGYYRQQKHPSLQIDPYFGTYYLQLNTNSTALSDPRVRKALSLVLNRTQIVEKITQGQQKAAWHFTPPGTSGYNPRISGEKNSEEAKRLLGEAGYPNGKGFPILTYLYNTSENNKAIAEVLQQMWLSELGIRIELINQEWKVFTQSRETGEFDILRNSWIGDYMDPTTFLDVWTSQSGNNFTGWYSETYDIYISNSRAAIDAGKRNEYFEKAEKLLINEQPIIPLYFYTSVYMKHPSVQGYYPTLLNYHPWKHVYLKPATP